MTAGLVAGAFRFPEFENRFSGDFEELNLVTEAAVVVEPWAPLPPPGVAPEVLPGVAGSEFGVDGAPGDGEDLPMVMGHWTPGCLQPFPPLFPARVWRAVCRSARAAVAMAAGMGKYPSGSPPEVEKPIRFVTRFRMAAVVAADCGAVGTTA